MRVQLLPFGILKESLGESSLELASHATVADLLTALQARFAQSPAEARLFRQIAVSVNAEYARADQELAEGDLVGLLPPVSGGAPAETQAPAAAAVPATDGVVTYLTREPIPAEELIAKAKQGSDGAVVIFDGIVRDNTHGRSTLYLDYEAYEEMAERQMAALASDAIQRFKVRAVTVVHRLGRLGIGETSVLILVASAHRAAAFEACRWLIDTLKKTVPIWKKETFADGIVWADGEPFPPELAAASAFEEPEELKP